MRIIRGFKKGKKLLLPDNKNTRPLKDIFKEAIFNILEHSNQIKIKINGSNVLDLFAGVGSFGLECLSRGANKVVFFVINSPQGFLHRQEEFLIRMSDSSFWAQI